MKLFARGFSALFSVVVMLGAPSSAHAETYRFQFKANPDALDAVQDKSLDVLHTVTLDSEKIKSFDAATLNSTSAWLAGGIILDMSHKGKTVRLNDAFDPLISHPVVHGAYYDEGFIDLWPGSSWFFSLEFAPGSPFIENNKLPYDPFVYGFLFSYQSDQAYVDFSNLWGRGDTSVLSKYVVPSVPEPESYAMLMAGLGLLAAAKRRNG